MEKMSVEAISMPESKLQRAGELRALLQSSESLAHGLTNCLSVSAQSASQSDAIDASLELLELADVHRSEAMQGMREQMKDHIRGRIPMYTKDQLVTLVRDMISIPLATDMQAVVADALKRLDPTSSSPTDVKNDTATLRDLLNSPTALRNLPPEVILQLPPSLVQLIWRTVPSRRLIDMSYLLHQVDTDTMAAVKPMYFQDLSVRPAIKGVRDAAVQRRKSAPVQRLSTFTRGAQDLYYSLCTLIAQHFERTHDAKWATLRTDLYLVNQDPDLLRANAKQLSGSGVQANRVGGVAQRELPADALAAVLEEMERILNTPERGSVENLLNLVRKALEPRSDGRSAADVPRTLQEQIVSVANSLYEQAPLLVDSGKTGQKVSDVFSRPVVDMFPGMAAAYCAKIVRPMDLGTIRVNARAGQYASFEALEKDVKLIGDNCKTFNQKTKDTEHFFRLISLLEARFSTLVTSERKQYATAIAKQQQQQAEKSAKAAPDLLSEQSGIMQLLMVMSEPFLVRHCLHVVLKGLYTSAREGLPLAQQGGEVLAAVRVLALGDIAQGRPKQAFTDANGKLSLDASAPAPVAGSFLFYDALARAAREVLLGGSAPQPAKMAAPSAPGKGGQASGASQPAPTASLPLTLRAALVSLQTAFMEYMLLRSGQQVQGVDSQQGSGGRPRSAALQALHALRRGTNIHGRTVSLLCLSVAISGSEAPMPHAGETLGYMLDLLKAALPPDSNKEVGPEPALLISCIPAFVRCAASAKQSISTAATGAQSPIHPFLTEAINTLMRPALELGSAVPHVRSLYHYAFATFLRTFADLPSVPADRAHARVLSPEACSNLVVMALTTAAEGQAKSMQGGSDGDGMQVDAATGVASTAGDSSGGSARQTEFIAETATRHRHGYNAELGELLHAGLVSPLSLIWTRPDFDAARRAYLLLVGSITPYLPPLLDGSHGERVPGRFPWGKIGLSLQSAAVAEVKLGGQSSGLPMPTPTGSLGHGFDTGAALYTPMTPASGGAPQAVPHLAHAHAGAGPGAFSQPMSKAESPSSYASEDATMR